METRSLAIGLVAIVAAFAAAFAVASSGGSKTETAGAGVKAAPITVAHPAAVTGVTVGGTIPALRVQHKAHAKKKKTKASAPATSSAPSTQKSAPSTQKTPPPPPQKSAPPTQNSAPAPSTNTAPAPSRPAAPSKPSKPAPSNNGPVSGGGEEVWDLLLKGAARLPFRTPAGRVPLAGAAGSARGIARPGARCRRSTRRT